VPNKRFKRDSQRVAFLLCVGFCDYGVMRRLGSGDVCPLTGRYRKAGVHGRESICHSEDTTT